MLSGKMYRFRVSSGDVDPRFVTYYLQSAQAWSDIDRMKTGGSDSGLNLTHQRFRTLQIPLAPSEEQRRVVATVEEQLSRLDAGLAAVTSVRERLVRLRASVLQAAVTGRLVPQQSDDEPAERWLEAQGKATVASPSLAQLPAGWARTSIGSLKAWSLYGPRFTSDDYVSDGVPVLRTSDVTPSGRILVERAPKLALSAEELAKYRVEAGDILVTRTGSIGTVAFIADDLPAIPGAYLILYRFGLPVQFAEYLFYCLQSPHIQSQLVRKSAGVGRPNVNAPSIDGILVAVPPFPELLRIVAAVRFAIGTIERVEATCTQLLERGRRLRAAVLDAAFSGQLAPQDPHDEPAESLLVRLHEDLLAVVKEDAREGAAAT
jgi:type I restriction enzyme S subunit